MDWSLADTGSHPQDRRLLRDRQVGGRDRRTKSTNPTCGKFGQIMALLVSGSGTWGSEMKSVVFCSSSLSLPGSLLCVTLVINNLSLRYILILLFPQADSTCA